MSEEIDIKLLITRHGETVENINGILCGQSQGNLSEKGIKDTKEFAKKISKIKFDVIFCSDLNRTKQTATEICKFHKSTPLIFTKLLREKNNGAYDGKKLNSISVKKYFNRTEKNDLDYKCGDGESIKDFYNRAEKFYNKMIRGYNNKTILLVTHSGFIKVLLSFMDCKKVEEINWEMKLDNNNLIEYNIKKQHLNIIN